MNQKTKIKAIAVLVVMVTLGGCTIITHQQRDLAEKELLVNQVKIEELEISIAQIQNDIEERKKEIQQEEAEKQDVKDVEQHWRSLGYFKITYYGLDITDHTATGKTPEIGKTIGVDPNVIPYHSIVMINGNIYEAQDTGNYKGNLIDVLCESEAVSEELGTHESEVFILEDWRNENE